MSNRTLLLGLDLGDDKTQLAVYNRESREPVFCPGSVRERKSWWRGRNPTR